MSRNLPAHPDLEHLKKQAKERLRELHHRHPGAKLADAQRTIAREYGFASWPKLKAHVESLAPSPGGRGGGGGRVAVATGDVPSPNYGFERYTPRARQALFFSRYEASQVGSTSIEPEHMLLGLIRAGQGLMSRILDGAHLSLEEVRAEVADLTVVGRALSSSVEIPFGAGTKRSLRYATEEADTLLHRQVGIAHLLLGILGDEGSVATSILRNKGMRRDEVRGDIVRLLNEELT